MTTDASNNMVDSGLLRANALFERISFGADRYYTVIPGNPKPKARPRMTRSGRAFLPAKDREAEIESAKYLSDIRMPKLTGNVALVCIFYRGDKRRVDTDNLVKHVCDAANRSNVWDDDTQVTALIGITEYDKQNPRTIVILGSHSSTLQRGTDIESGKGSAVLLGA